MYVASLPSEAGAAAAELRAANRSRGRVRLSFGLRAGHIALDELFQEGCSRVLRPHVPPGSPPQAVLLNTGGGITGGDEMETTVRVGNGAGAVITSQAAEKIYRSAGGEGHVTTDLSVADGAWLAWLPQETILFDGGRLQRETRISVAAGGRLLACEAIGFGRQARKERVHNGYLRDSWRLERDGTLAWADSLRLDGNIAGILARTAIADGAMALASVLYVADDAEYLLPVARDLAGCAHVTAAATSMGHILLARFAADSLYALRAELVPFLSLMLEAAHIPAALPQAWSQ